MAYSDILNKVSQTKLDNLDLILAKLRQGDGGSPYTAPPKDDPDRKYVPSPGKKLVSTPQDGRAPTRLFYNPPYDNPKMFIKDEQTIKDAKERFKWNTGIDLANLTPKMFTPFDMNLRDEDDGIINHIITPAIHETQMEHFKRFIKNTGDSTWDLVNSGNGDMMIAGLPYSPPIERMVIGKKLIDSPLRFRTDAERIRLMEDFAKYDRPRT